MWLSMTLSKLLIGTMMLDSFGRPPAGMMSGRLADYGAYDQCLAVRHPQNAFQGKYCLIHVRGIGKITPRFQELSNKYLEHINFKYVGNLSDLGEATEIGEVMPFFKLGSCIPSSCRKEDLQVILDIGVLSTLVLGFSLRRAILKLTQMPNWGDYSNELGFVHGMRVLSATWVVLGHSLVVRDIHHNSDFIGLLRKMQKDIFFCVQMQSFMAVGSFFVITGFLSGYLVVKAPKVKFNVYLLVLFAFIRRYIRLVPSMLAVLGAMYMIPLLVSGPLLEDMWSFFERPCTKHWWKILTMTHNFPDDITDFVSASLDLQLNVPRQVLRVLETITNINSKIMKSGHTFVTLACMDELITPFHIRFFRLSHSWCEIIRVHLPLSLPEHKPRRVQGLQCPPRHLSQESTLKERQNYPTTNF
ncbi:hypothetical protein HPB47_023687 [Ixodes persulcatus]|uniref:Uncharacterized protein n=1 Tax=Ixodes persulcatus TaxID=34615 RepID=A0AC60Q6P3_IXOPE|nr:hypothetical protein HPB47_023687 [Ixodes persulcatus]